MGERQKVNVNTASREELKRIDGVGNSLADRIIKHREHCGGFRSERELDELWRLAGEPLERGRGQVTL